MCFASCHHRIYQKIAVIFKKEILKLIKAENIFLKKFLYSFSSGRLESSRLPRQDISQVLLRSFDEKEQSPMFYCSCGWLYTRRSDSISCPISVQVRF